MQTCQWCQIVCKSLLCANIYIKSVIVDLLCYNTRGIFVNCFSFIRNMVRIIIIGVIRTIRKGPRVNLSRRKDESVDILLSFVPHPSLIFVYFSQSWEVGQSVCLTVSSWGHVCLSDMRTLLSAPLSYPSVCLFVCMCCPLPPPSSLLCWIWLLWEED